MVARAGKQRTSELRTARRVGILDVGPFLFYNHLMDQRSQDNINSLQPAARPWFASLLSILNGLSVLPAGYTVKIISGNRTYDEQNKLYNQGRFGNKGPIVTNARGGQSHHNFGIAVDIGIFDGNGTYIEDDALYIKLGPVGVKAGLDWGGNWNSIKDYPHYEIPTGKSLSELRGLMPNGIPIPTFGGATNVPMTPSASTTVTVGDDDNSTDIPAQLINGRVWVGVRKFIEHFGGVVEEASATAFKLSLHGTEIALVGQIIGGVGMAKFADINTVLKWGYTFDDNHLRVHTNV